MDRNKPFEIIAARFQISSESAKYFLARVQKRFQTEKPTHQMIVDFMSGEIFESLPKPHEVARQMNERGVWVYPLNPEPPRPIAPEDEDLYV